MATIPKDLTKLSDERLAELSAELAAERTRIRESQNVVQAEIDLRAALAGMSGSSAEILRIRLGGGVTPSGDAATEVK